MDMPSSSLPASLLRQWAFCPRIPWFMEALGLSPPRPLWVRQGVEHHQRERMLQRRRRLSRYGLEGARLVHNPSLSAPGLGLHGIPDALLETGYSVHPLEFKLGEAPPGRGHELQIAAYGLLAESCFGKPCPSGFILYGARGKTREIRLTEEIRAHMFRVLAELRRSLDNALMPVTSAGTAQCTQCEFLNYCNDRE